MSRAGHSERGVTLTEMLALIAILGIIAVVAIPNFNAMLKSYRVSTAVNELVATMNLARQLAVTRREVHTLAPLADPENRWTLTNTVTGEVVQTGTMPDGVEVTVAPAAAFSFNANGACSNPTTYTGTTPTGQYVRVEGLIHSSRTDRYTLELSPVGRVKTTRTQGP